MGWVIGGIVVLGLLVLLARRRGRRHQPYDRSTLDRIGLHEVEMGARQRSHEHGPFG
jgi:hypothetical protein